MKYHPDILYATYHFGGHVGRHIKLKICSEMVKKAKYDTKKGHKRPRPFKRVHFSNLIFMVPLNDHVKTCSLVER